jgi:hypothetical protein
MGINSNVCVNGVTFHVQSEDLGPRIPQLITHVFREGGTVVKVVKLDYSVHLSKPHLQTVLLRIMKAHHVKVLRKLERGRMDSIPPAIVMRPTTTEEDARLFTETAVPRNSLAELSSQVQASNPMSDNDSHSVEHLSENAPQSCEKAAHVWDRIVAEAQHSRIHEPHQRKSEKSPPPAVEWEKITQSRRREVTLPQAETPDAATSAYQDGLASMRHNDASLAVQHLAKAVAMDPSNRRFRAALRRALDFADEQESQINVR